MEKFNGSHNNSRKKARLFINFNSNASTRIFCAIYDYILHTRAEPIITITIQSSNIRYMPHNHNGDCKYTLFNHPQD